MNVMISECWNVFHINEFIVLLKHFPQIKVCGIWCDSIHTSLLRDAEEVASQHKLPLWVCSAAELEAQIAWDAFFIAPCPTQLFDTLTRFADYGRHIFTDKLQDMTAAQLHALEYLCVQKQLCIRTEFPFLSRPLIQTVQAIIKCGALGQIQNIVIRNAGNALLHNALPQRFLSYPQGILYDFGIHPLYVALTMLHTPFDAILHAEGIGAMTAFHAELQTNSCTVHISASYTDIESLFSVFLEGTAANFSATVQQGKIHYHTLPPGFSADELPTENQQIGAHPDIAEWLFCIHCKKFAFPPFYDMFLKSLSLLLAT